MDEFDARAPAGNHTIDVTLSGQVNSAIPTGHGLNFSLETVIERPLDVRVREPSMWVIDGRNDTGGITSNSSLRDGDRLVAQVPVQNSGGVPWNGTLAARLDGSSVHVFPDAVVALAPHQTQIVVLNHPSDFRPARITSMSPSTQRESKR